MDRNKAPSNLFLNGLIILFFKSKRLIMKYTLIVLLSAYAFAGSISLDKEIKITSSSKVEMYTALF